jgi:hypothetical protein
VKRCLQTALQWRMVMDESKSDCRYVHLPGGMIEEAIHRTISIYVGNHQNKWKNAIPTERDVNVSTFLDRHVLEQIDLPPQETPNELEVTVYKRRASSDSFTPEAVQDQSSTPLMSSASLTPETVLVSSQTKRRRITESSKAPNRRNISKNVSESVSFTEKLKNLLHGSASIDLMIGDGKSFLSDALADAPPLITEIDDMKRIFKRKSFNIYR